MDTTENKEGEGELEKFPVRDPDALTKTLRPLKLRERLATLRSMYNLSQGEASDAIRRKRNAWSNWEAEEDNPRRTVPGPRSRAALAYVFSLPQSLFVDD